MKYASSIVPSGRNRIAEVPASVACSDSELVTRIQPPLAVGKVACPSGNREGVLGAAHLLEALGDQPRREALRQHQRIGVGRPQRSIGPGACDGGRGERRAQHARPEGDRSRGERSGGQEAAAAEGVHVFSPTPGIAGAVIQP
jgi:hypothetical protein